MKRKTLKGLILPALVGFIIAMFLSPLISPLISRLYVGLDLVDKPKLTVKGFYSPVSQSYEEGSRLKDFDNAVWKEDYGIYNFLIHNTGEVPITNLRVEINFLGDVISSKKVLAGGADFIILDTTPATVIENGIEVGNLRYCSKIIRAYQLLEDQAIIVGFIIDHKIRENTYYIDFNPTNDYSGEYTWYYRDANFKEEIIGHIEGREDITKAVWVNHGIWIRNNFNALWESITYFNLALTMDPTYTPALLQRGISYGTIGDNESDFNYLMKSLEDFEKLVLVEENNKKGWFNKGIVEYMISKIYYQQGEEEKSEEYYQLCKNDLEKAISIDPNYEKAIQELNMVMEEYPF